MIAHNKHQLLLLATTYAPTASFTVDKHLDGYHTIQYMERGGVSLAYDDRAFTLEGGWFWTAYPGPRTFFTNAPGYPSWFHRHVGFRGPLVEEWIDAGLWFWDPQPAPSTRHYPAFFDELIGLAQRTDDWGWRRAVNMLEQLLLELTEARAAGTADRDWTGEVMTALGESTDFAPDYEDIARRFGMGLSTLRRRFRESTGVSIHQHVMRIRVDEARRLLAETSLPIARIADLLHYDNVYFFSRQFRQSCGVSPTEFRNSRLSIDIGMP